MNKSDSIKNIAAALATFQVKAEKIIKRDKNPFFNSTYAGLPSILDAIAVPLQESGLVVSQFPDGDALTTILMHPDSGEWLEATGQMHPVKSDPQAMGSAITYQRRYALCAVLGLNVDNDDDGNKASEPAKPEQSEPVHWLNPGTDAFEQAKKFIRDAVNKKEAMNKLRKKYAVSKPVAEQLLQ